MKTLLGSFVRDSISGFEGTVIGEAYYLYTAPQVQIAPAGLYNSQPIQPLWFDVDRLEIIIREAKTGFMMHKGEK